MKSQCIGLALFSMKSKEQIVNYSILPAGKNLDNSVNRKKTNKCEKITLRYSDI